MVAIAICGKPREIESRGVFEESEMTHTYAELGISKSAYDEIVGKLRAAGYHHAFHEGGVDMQGIGLVVERDPKPVVEYLTGIGASIDPFFQKHNRLQFKEKGKRTIFTCPACNYMTSKENWELGDTVKCSNGLCGRLWIPNQPDKGGD